MNEFLEKYENHVVLKKTFKKGMTVEPIIYVNEPLLEPLLDEFKTNTINSFTQLAHMASLPSVRAVYGLPDIHGGYGFPIGSVVGFDLDQDDCIVSPGGVGYDINCGVRSLATNLTIEEFTKDLKKKVANSIFNAIPTGMSSKGCLDNMKTGKSSKNTRLRFEPNSLFSKDKEIDFNNLLENGLEYLSKMGLLSCGEIYKVEERGKIIGGNAASVSFFAKERGINQLGSLGSGNHYLEIQYVSEIYNRGVARDMGINRIGQIIITVHTGSRGLGHQTCADYLKEIRSSSQNFEKNFEYARVNSDLGQRYLESMACASNYAFCNRSIISKLAVEMMRDHIPHCEANLIYDVCHNIAKKERHVIGYKPFNLLVHRKGASRSFGPFRNDIPSDYYDIGQPVLVGGSMGTSSYILTGTETAMDISLGSACHGAGRLIARGSTNEHFNYDSVIDDLNSQNILLKARSPKGVVEEAPGCYKDVDVVVNLCQDVGITKKVCKVKPFIVIKG